MFYCSIFKIQSHGPGVAAGHARARGWPRGGRRKADVVLTEVAKIDEKNHEMTDFKKFAKKLSSEC